MSEHPDESRQVNDNELLKRYQAGDEGAFATLVRRYRRELYNFLARFLHDTALAEDVFQETFLQLHISAGAFDPSRRLKPWLFTISANKARDAMRSRQRRQAAPLDAAIQPHAAEQTSYVSLMPDSVPPPDAALMNLESRRAVQNIIGEMPENLRLVLVLSYFHELPYKEIAEILSLPLGTVKSRLHSAVKYFAAKWKATYQELGHEGKTR
ncbi:MAG: RNA polymerase sigma factor [Planctomycetota bacterium]